MKKIFLAGLLTLMGSVSQAQIPKDELVMGITGEFENLNPIIGSTAVSNYMMYTSWRRLVSLGLDNKWKATLVKQVPTLENKLAKKNGAGLDVTLEILDLAKWGDGTPVTCKDVEFGWKVALNENVSNPDRESARNVTAVKWDTKTPKKCMISFAKAKFDYQTGYPYPMPAHLEEPILTKFGNQREGYDNNSLYTKDPTNPGLYMGPYRVSELKLGSHVIFVPNPHFYGKKPYFKKIIFKLIPNSGTLEANLRSGTINMIPSVSGLGIDQADEMDKKFRTENLPFEMLFEDGVVYAHIDLNMAHPALADIKVRKALAYGFSKKEIVKSILAGRAKVASHYATNSDPVYTENVTQYDYNRREAARLLDEAGWKMGAKGLREKNGTPLRLTLIGASGNKLIEMIEAHLQDKYKALGIELIIKNEAARVFFGDTLLKRNFEMAIFSWSSVPENPPRTILYSNQIPTKENSYSGQNYTGYKSPEMDKWIDEYEVELNQKKRIAIGHKILKKYTEDLPVIPLYYRQVNSANPKGMKGFKLSGHQFYETLYIEDWSM